MGHDPRPQAGRLDLKRLRRVCAIPAAEPNLELAALGPAADQRYAEHLRWEAERIRSVPITEITVYWLDELATQLETLADAHG